MGSFLQELLGILYMKKKVIVWIFSIGGIMLLLRKLKKLEHSGVGVTDSGCSARAISAPSSAHIFQRTISYVLTNADLCVGQTWAA